MELLSEEAVAERLRELDVAWTAIGNDYLVRTFKTKDFADGVALINRIAELSGALDHHPDVSLTYNRIELRVSTHAVAGVTEADITFAHKIDELMAE